MVEPIDAQNLLSRTPLVEKTAATAKDSLVQQNLQAEQAQKERLNEGEQVTSQGETKKTEDKPKKEGASSEEQEKKGTPEKRSNVEWVDEPADEPDHNLDITI